MEARRFEGNGYRAAYGPEGTSPGYWATRSVEPIPTETTIRNDRKSSLYPYGWAQTESAHFDTIEEATAWCLHYTHTAEALNT